MDVPDEPAVLRVDEAPGRVPVAEPEGEAALEPVAAEEPEP